MKQVTALLFSKSTEASNGVDYGPEISNYYTAIEHLANTSCQMHAQRTVPPFEQLKNKKHFFPPRLNI